MRDLNPLALVPDIDDRGQQAPMSWLETLRGAVRPEFAQAVYTPQPGDPALWPRICRVETCDGPAHANRLCARHQRMWDNAQRPDLDTWVTSDEAMAPSSLARNNAVRPCPVQGCRRSAPGKVCRRHEATARAHFEGEYDRMVASLIETDEFAGRGIQTCYVPWCAFPVSPRHEATTDEDTRMCDAHSDRYESARQHRIRTGRPPLTLDEFVAGRRETNTPKFRTIGVPEALQWEVFFALQCRHDQGKAQWRTDQHSTFMTCLRRTGITTLLMGEDDLVAAFRAVTSNPQIVGFARFALEMLRLLRDMDSVDIFERDKWDLVALGFDLVARGASRHLSFAEIEPHWLKEATKAWILHRLNTKEISTIQGNIRSIRTFSRLLSKRRALPGAPEDLSRASIELFVRALRQAGYAKNYRRSLLTDLSSFLDFAHRSGAAKGLSSTVQVYREDRPQTSKSAPRAISEFVMAQIETPESLASIRSPEARVLVQLLIETGLRGQCARRLSIDSVVRDPSGRFLLRFMNTKFKREAIIPISGALALVLLAQRERALAQWPRTPWMFPRQRQNPTGAEPFAASAFKEAFKDWRTGLDLRDEAGRSVHITPHQFRHTVGTRMVNAGVPLEVVRTFLDHSSVQMTEVYARLAPTTVRNAAQHYLDRMDQVFSSNIPVDPSVLANTPPSTGEAGRVEPSNARAAIDAAFDFDRSASPLSDTVKEH